MRRLLLLLIGLLALAGVAVASSGGATKAQARWVIGDLGTLGGDESYAVAINNHGDIVGTSQVERGSSREHAFFWHEAKMADLKPLGGKESSAAAINDRGEIVGSADTKSDQDRGGACAALWRRGRITVLGSSGGWAEAINEAT